MFFFSYAGGNEHGPEVRGRPFHAAVRDVGESGQRARQCRGDFFDLGAQTEVREAADEAELSSHETSHRVVRGQRSPALVCRKLVLQLLTAASVIIPLRALSVTSGCRRRLPRVAALLR